MTTNLTIFNSAVTALGASSLGISVAANNIANVNTPGYSRQRAILGSLQPQVTGGIEVGRGVQVLSVERIFDLFSQNNLIKATGAQARNDASAEQLARVEDIFNETGGSGLSSFMSDFFNAWHDVANDPDSISARKSLLGKANILATRFQELSQNLKNTRLSIDTSIRDSVTSINSLATSIANINDKIATSGGDTLVLKDQRNELVRQLAEITDVTTVDSTDGTFQVYIGQGLPLVTGVTHATLSTQADAGNSGLLDVMFSSGVSQPVEITSRFTSGKMKGLLDVRDTTIPSYQSTLDELAYEFHGAINTIHSAGYNLNGATGVDFFTALGSSTDAAANLTLDAAVLGNPNALAASGTLADIPGGNSVALSLAQLQNGTVTFSSGTTSIGSFYSDMLATIGNDVRTANISADFANNILVQSANLRERISGVSIEEEQLSLLRQQASFQAAARLVSVAGELLNEIVNLI